MGLKKISKKKDTTVLEDVARHNAIATKGTSQKQVVIKEGVPSDHSPKHLPNKDFGSKVAGVNIGITKNMGDYESLRVDCWITDTIREGETHSQAIKRLGDIAYAEVERQVSEIVD